VPFTLHVPALLRSHCITGVLILLRCLPHSVQASSRVEDSTPDGLGRGTLGEGERGEVQGEGGTIRDGLDDEQEDELDLLLQSFSVSTHSQSKSEHVTIPINIFFIVVSDSDAPLECVVNVYLQKLAYTLLEVVVTDYG